MARHLGNCARAIGIFFGAGVLTLGVAFPVVAQGVEQATAGEIPPWAVGALVVSFVALLGLVWKLTWRVLKDEAERQDARLCTAEKKIESLEEVRVDVARLETKVDTALCLLEKLAEG